MTETVEPGTCDCCGRKDTNVLVGPYMKRCNLCSVLVDDDVESTSAPVSIEQFAKAVWWLYDRLKR